MKVLIGCECSGTIKRAFAALGHEAYSCDLQPSIYPHNHIVGDIFEVFYQIKPTLFIVHPPCTYLSTIGNRHISPNCTPQHIVSERLQKRETALKFAQDCWSLPAPFLALENPVGYLNTHPNFPTKDQIIHPYYFGDPHLKRTCLWLKNLPQLSYPINPTKPEPLSISPKGKNYYFTDLAKPDDNGKQRSKTFPSIAKAMAEQWSWWINLKQRLQQK